jgi:phosphoribosylformimino-5-aminoimidazole carboxamide ribotide isomerase
MEIIPAIDIIGGKCVRLTQGDFARQKQYPADPLDLAKGFESAGLRRLHLVDLDGARLGEVKNWKVLESIAAGTGLAIDFGGGIKSLADLEMVFNAGASWASLGSLAVRGEDLFKEWITRFGPDKFLLGADVRGEKIVIRGWTEMTEISVYELVEKYLQEGLRQIFCTDVEKDGLLGGPSLELYKKLKERFPELELIASGGIRSLADLEDLREIGCSGAILGKAIYEGKLGLEELGAF